MIIKDMQYALGSIIKHQLGWPNRGEGQNKLEKRKSEV